MTHQESYFIPIHNAKLHLQRIYQNPEGTPVLLLHGAIENGQIFYSKNLKGLAPYLAKQGFDVYVGDLRGRGKSIPAIDSKADYGQTEAITEDIPAFINQIIKLRGECKQHWLAHSWGGVLLSSYYARFKEHRHLVNSMVYFAAKRKIHVMNWQRLLYVDFFWEFMGPILTAFIGFLPAKQLHIGSDNETKKSLTQSIEWINSDDWIDDDGFNYGKAIRQIDLPPIWYMTGLNDKCLGNPYDVFTFMLESGSNNGRISVLGKKYGNLHNYNHIDILTYPGCERDHFPLVAEWLRQHE